jgi:hypothetical protein
MTSTCTTEYIQLPKHRVGPILKSDGVQYGTDRVNEPLSVTELSTVINNSTDLSNRSFQVLSTLSSLNTAHAFERMHAGTRLKFSANVVECK